MPLEAIVASHEIEAMVLSLPRRVEEAEFALLKADKEYRDEKERLAKLEGIALMEKHEDGTPVISGKSEADRGRQLAARFERDRSFLETLRLRREEAVIIRDRSRNEFQAWTAVAKLRGGGS